jgi:hypothetical protein
VTVHLSREATLVLRSARITPDPEWHALCAQPLRWQEVIAVAADERAASVLSRRLPPNTPDDARAALRRFALVAEFRHAQLEQLYKTTLAALASAGRDAVLLKGGALMARGIATAAERPMSDLDLLLPPDQAQNTWEQLQDCGWRWDRERFPAPLYERQHHLPPLVDAGGSSYRLEVHRDLFPPFHPFALSADDVRRASTTVQSNETPIRVPDSTHLLVHSAIHFAWAHTLESKAWRTLRDVELLTTRTEVDWSELVDTALQVRAGSCTYWTLRLAQSVIGTPIPHDVLERLKPPRSDATLRRLERHYARNMLLTPSRCPSDRMRRVFWEAGICPKHQGHGTARPWDGTFRIPEVQQWDEGRGTMGVSDRLRQTGRLARYVWELR